MSFKGIGLSWLIHILKVRLIRYFAKNICPPRFSLSSEEAKNNDFYEVHIYIPDGDNSDIALMPKSHRGALNVLFEFIPKKPSYSKKGYIRGKAKKREDSEFSEFYLESKFLRYARIDVYYYYGHWSVREDQCSILILIKLFLLRATRLIYFDIAVSKIVRYFRNRKINKRLRTPLRSKFDIYEALMDSDSFLRRGTFKKSELSSLIFGNHSSGEFKIYQKVSQSLDWVLEACIDDEEIEKVSHSSSDDPLYKVKGKGIHYFTLTKENIMREEENRIIQRQQVKIQHRMLLLTFLLVIATFLTGIDKIDHLNAIYEKLVAYSLNIIELLYEITT